MSDYIILFCTIFGTIVAFLAYKSTTTDPLHETREITLEKMEFLGKINHQLISDLKEYGEANNSFSEIFMQGLSFQQCIDLLEKIKVGIINSENQEAVQKSKSKMRLDEIIKNLDIQIKHHSEVRTVFDYFIKR